MTSDEAADLALRLARLHLGSLCYRDLCSEKDLEKCCENCRPYYEAIAAINKVREVIEARHHFHSRDTLEGERKL